MPLNATGRAMASRRVLAAVAFLLLSTGLDALGQVGPGRDPVGDQPQIRPAATGDVRDRLKKAVDRSLAKFVRELRAELHRTIDEAVADGSLDELLRELDGGRLPSPVGSPPGSAPSVLGKKAPPRPAVILEGKELDQADRLLRGFDRLIAKVGADDPRVKETEVSLRALLGDATFELPRVPWHAYGLEVFPVQAQVREANGLAPMEGLWVRSVQRGSTASAAGIKPGALLLNVGLGGRDTRRIRDLVTDQKRIRVVVSDAVVAEGKALKTRVAIVPVPQSLAGATDSKALMDDMLRRAIKDVVPKGGVVIPRGGGGETRPHPGSGRE